MTTLRGDPYRIPLAVTIPRGGTGSTVADVILPRVGKWYPWADLVVQEDGSVEAVVERDALDAAEARVRRIVKDEVERDLRTWLEIGTSVLARKVAP